MTAEASIVGQAGEKDVLVRLDTGADTNVISAHLVEELGLAKADYKEPRIRWGGGKPAYCYGAYTAHLHMTDSAGERRQIEAVLYSVDREDRDVILGMPSMKQEGIQIDTGIREWRFAVEAPTIRMISASEWPTTEEESNYHQILLIQTPTNDNPDRENHPLPEELKAFADVFEEKAAALLPQHKNSDHAIETTAEPPHYPIYSMSVRELEVLRGYLREAQANGWIRPSVSPAGAPVLFVPKKNGELRLCVDYRGLNKITVKNRYPLPLISEILDRLSGSVIFTKLDLKNAYYRIRIKEGDEWKTAFRTRYGHFEYLVMPFGLANAPASFQAYINTAMGDYVDTICVVYLDDILIYSKDRETHVRDVCAVLARLRAYELYCNPEKCVFFVDEVDFLGFLVGKNGIRMDPSRVETIKDWPTPESFKDVQVFLGFCGFYRRFIEAFARIASALTALLKGSKNGTKFGPFEWNADADQAFRKLRDAFTKAPIIRHFDPKLQIKLEADASGFALACILSQLFANGAWHPIAFYSRKLKDAETRYETYDQELLAIVAGFKHWRHYLEGSLLPIQVYTDHRNLMGLARVTQLNGRQARWAMYLAGYDFTIQHRPGKTNPADAPSRRPDYASGPHPVDRLLPTLRRKMAVLPEEVAVGAISAWEQEAHKATRMENEQQEEYETDRMPNAAIRSIRAPWTQETRRQVIEDDHPTGGQKGMTLRSVAIRELSGEGPYAEGPIPELLCRAQATDEHAKSMRLDVESNRAHKDWTVNRQDLLLYQKRVYVPEEQAIRQELLKRCHNDPLAGHFGADRTHDLLKRRYYWPKMNEDVVEYVKTCDICQRIKVKRHKPYGQMHALPQPAGPWQEITMDFMSGIPPSKRDGCVYDAILVIVDRYSKMALYIPVTKKLSAVELAEVFVERVIARFGAPKGIVSDRDAKFTSKFWSELCYCLRIRRRLSTAFHPQTDGQTERQNQTIQEYLRAYCIEQPNSWAKMLPLAEFAYNNSKHATTGISPFYAVYNFHPEIYYDVEADADGERVPAAREKAQQLQNTRRTLEERWRVASEAQAKHYNRKHEPLVFNKGNLVMLSTKNLSLKHPSKKLAPRYLGPFRILEPVGTQAYRLQLPASYKFHNVFHISLLEPYTGVRDAGEEAELLPGPQIVIDDEEYWEIEEILGRKPRLGKIWYLIKWKGYPEEYNQWIENDEIPKEMRKEYDSRTKRKRGRPARSPKAPGNRKD
jgi:transposase InsO family protein